MGEFPKYKLFFIILFLLFSGLNSYAQQGIYIPKKGKIFFVGDTATLFSDVVNKGKFGVGKKAVVNFKGRKWENDPEALITDEESNGEEANGTGGIIRFNNENFRQQLDGGYNQVTKTGASFSILQISNRFGVELINSTSQIRSNLHFIAGNIYLNTNLLVIGKGHPGSITGFTKNRFIITGSNFNGGALIRENIRQASGLVTFPVGTSENNYAPAGIRAHFVQGDDYYVSVADNVYTALNTGQNLNANSVNKTWEIGKLRRPGQDKTELILEHAITEEGTVFNTNRSNSYISQYTGAGWDTSFPRSNPKDGILSTEGPDNKYGQNNRNFQNSISASSFFTKFSSKIDTSHQTKLWFNAERLSWTHARAFWRTNPEINVNYFVLQRRLGNDTTYQNRDTIDSKANGGLSFSDLHYDVTDPNEYQGISYYRLMIVDHAGNIFYSNIVPVGFRPGGSGALIWPNPNHGRFFAGINGDNRIKSIAMYNIIGQKIHEEQVNGRNIIELTVRIPGTYTVAFIGISGNFIDVRKVLVPVIY